jgi:hypothetical protein
MPELFKRLADSAKPQRTEKCGQCARIQKWERGSQFFFYCGIKKSGRTANGLLKVKCGNPACGLFEKNNVQSVAEAVSPKFSRHRFFIYGVSIKHQFKLSIFKASVYHQS